MASARRRSPLLTELASGTNLWCIHKAEHSPLWFGPGPGDAPINRFDAPAGEYRIGYFGMSRDGAFAEVFLRVPPVEIVAMDEIALRRITSIEITRPVRLAQLHGAGLARLGITASATTGADYAHARHLALELWSQASPPDGVLYRARHDDEHVSVALFHTAESSLRVGSPRPLTDDRGWLADLAVRYGFDFTP
ncbi:MAG: RES family NAD+ phosphorylase [Gemmatimonadaceae bacterium]